jgi:phosphatidylinositol glycan class W
MGRGKGKGEMGGGLGESCVWDACCGVQTLSDGLCLCVCMVAVRRFAKSESFGTGLMDLGVGSFMFANGLSSRFARYLL